MLVPLTSRCWYSCQTGSCASHDPYFNFEIRSGFGEELDTADFLELYKQRAALTCLYGDLLQLAISRNGAYNCYGAHFLKRVADLYLYRINFTLAEFLQQNPLFVHCLKQALPDTHSLEPEYVALGLFCFPFGVHGIDESTYDLLGALDAFGSMTARAAPQP